MSKNFKKKNFHKTPKNEVFEGQVRAKKHLGQHFLKDEEVASKIADTLSYTAINMCLKLGREWEC